MISAKKLRARMTRERGEGLPCSANAENLLNAPPRLDRLDHGVWAMRRGLSRDLLRGLDQGQA